MLGRGHIFVCQLVLAVAMVALFAPAANAAAPICDPLTLPDVHSGGSTSGQLMCDDGDGDPLSFYVSSDGGQGFASVDGAGSVTYNSNWGYKGPDSFEITVDDNNGATTTVDVQVEVTNTAPVCQGVDLGETAPGAQAFGYADCSDADDFDSFNFSYSVSSPPAHGTASVDFGSIVYTPDSDYSGPDSFQYTVSDGVDTSAPATVSVDVVNHAPTCDDQSRELRTGKPITAYPNCSDQDGQNLTYTVVAGPDHGTATFADDGSGNQRWTYTPDAGFTGEDSFTIRANDGYGDSGDAVVSLTVTPNHPPECTTLPQHTKVNQALPLTLFCSDPDSQDSNSVSYAVVGITHGTTTGFGQSGGFASVTYNPTSDYSGPADLTFTASDGDLTTQGVQRVHVANTPLCDPMSPIEVRSGRSKTLSPACTWPSDDFGTRTYVIDTQPTRGTASVNEFTGTITYTAANDASGADSLTFHLQSSSSGSSPAVTVQITTGPGVNENPTCTDTGTQPAYAGRAASLFPFCTDAENDPILFSVPGQPAHGTSTVTNGVLTYTPTPGYTGADSVPYTATDSHGGTATGAVAVMVAPPEAPTCANQGTVPTVRPGGSVTLFLDCSNPQADDQTYVVDAPPAHGNLDDFDDGAVTYTADVDAPTGTDSMTFHAENVVGSSSTKTFHVNIDPSYNRAPVCATNFAGRKVKKNTARSLNFADVCSDPDGDPITFTRTSLPSHGTLSAGPAASLTYTPATDYLGSDSFTYTATDSRGVSTGVMTYLISVVASIDPTCATRPTLTLRPGMQRPITFDCQDPDLQAITYEIVSGPAHGTLSPAGSSTNPTRTYTAGSTAGPDSFTYRATSAGGTSTNYTQNVSIDASYNTAPNCISNAGFPDAVQQGQSIEITVPCSDDEGDDLTASANPPAPQHGSAEFSGDTITYTADSGYTGTDQIGFSVSDGHGGTKTGSAYVTVNAAPANTEPSCNAAPVSTPQGTPVTVQLECTDADSDTLTLSIVEGPNPSEGTLGAIDQNLQRVQFTPADGFSGQVTFSYHAWDGIVFSDPAIATVTVEPPAGGGDDDGSGGGGDTGGSTGGTGGSTGGTGGSSGGTGGSPGGTGGSTGSGSGSGDSPPASGSGTPPAGGSTTPAPIAPGLTLGAIPKQKLANVLKKGFSFKANCAGPCTLIAKLQLASKLAKKFKLAAADVTLGTTKKSMSGGATTLVVKLSAKARKRLKNVRSLQLKLLLTATTPSGGKQSVLKPVTLKR